MCVSLRCDEPTADKTNDEMSANRLEKIRATPERRPGIYSEGITRKGNEPDSFLRSSAREVNKKGG